jgi:hypothetical protein
MLGLVSEAEDRDGIPHRDGRGARLQALPAPSEQRGRPDRRRWARRAPWGRDGKGTFIHGGTLERARERPPRRLPGDRPLAHSITFVAQLARNRLHPSFLGSSTVSALPRAGHPPTRPSPWIHAIGAKSGQSHRSPLASSRTGELLGRLRAPIRSRSLPRFQDAMP